MRKASVGTAHILNVNVRKKTLPSLTLACKRKWVTFSEEISSFFFVMFSITIIPAICDEVLYVAYDSRASLSITHATVMVITRVM